jgi:hypothetical protein
VIVEDLSPLKDIGLKSSPTFPAPHVRAKVQAAQLNNFFPSNIKQNGLMKT